MVSEQKRCPPPQCHQTPSGDCALPSPWLTFQRAGLAKGLTVSQRRRAYGKFKAAYLSQTGHDPVAYRAALCLGRPPKTEAPIPAPAPAQTLMQRYVSGLRARLESNRVHYTKECDMDKKLLTFFATLFHTSIKSTTLSPCQVVGLILLRQCVPPEEVKYYTFSKLLGIGTTGFVFECLYKGKERRAVKMMMVGESNKETVKLTKDISVSTIAEPSLRREFEMHRLVMARTTASSLYRVLDIYGDLAVFRPALSRRRVGVYIMQTLPYPTLDQDLSRAMSKRNAFLSEAFLKKIETLPRIIADLHRHGLAHSDLHAGNVAFDPANQAKPYILDFGRMLVLESTFPKPAERATFRAIDQVIPLYTFVDMVKDKSPPPDSYIVEMYNSFLRGLDIPRSLAGVPAKLRKELATCFQPIDPPVKESITRRLAAINFLLYYTTPFFEGEHTFFDVAVGI